MPTAREERMINWIMGLFGFGGPEHDAKVLARDARAMIEMINGQHGPESLVKNPETAPREDRARPRERFE